MSEGPWRPRDVAYATIGAVGDDTPPTVPPAPPRRRRPPLDAKVDLRLTAKQFDAAYAHARASRCTVSEYVRRVLQAATRDQ